MITTPRKRFDVDTLGENLTRLALMARQLPPAYLGAGVREPVYSREGARLGEVLDGKGLYLDVDLKRLGITKKIPHVFQRSRTQRLLDKLGDERGAITSYDDVSSAVANEKQDRAFATKTSFTTVANVWSSTFLAGGVPAAGAYGAGATKNETDTGALSGGLLNPPSGSLYLASFGQMSSAQLNLVALVDLLAAEGSYSCTSTLGQGTATPALTRYTTGAGVYMTLEVTTALGATLQNVTVIYTNQAGTANQSTAAIGMTPSCIVKRLQPSANGCAIALAAGDFGVRVMQSLQFSAGNTAGVVAVNLFKPLLWMPVTLANVPVERNLIDALDLVALPTDGTNIGCLTTYIFPNSAVSGQHEYSFRTIWG